MEDINQALTSLVREGDVENTSRILTEQDVFKQPNNDYVEKRSQLLTQANCREMVELLIHHGALVNWKDGENRTPLHNTVFYRSNLSVITSLLKHGADPNARNDYEETPLIVAARRYQKRTFPIVKELLKFGANVNDHDIQGSSALCLAIYRNHKELINELLNSGADIFSKCTAGGQYVSMYSSPFEVAMYCNLEASKTLIKRELLRDFTPDYYRHFNMDKFKKVKHFTEISEYMEACATELIKMTNHKIKNYTLYDFVASKLKNHLTPLYLSCTLKALASEFKIYKQKINDRLPPHIERAKLLDKLRDLKLTLKINTSGPEGNALIEVTLNSDCLCKIGDFLINEDLLNFVTMVEECNECKTHDGNSSSDNNDEIIPEISVRSKVKSDSAPPVVKIIPEISVSEVKSDPPSPDSQITPEISVRSEVKSDSAPPS